MSSRPSTRPRRTRIYGANYDIGESYYKKQLDDLDRKRGINTRFPDPIDFSARENLIPKVSFQYEPEDDFKFKPRSSFKNRSHLDDFDDEILSSDSLKKSYDFTKKGRRFMDDGDDLKSDIFQKKTFEFTKRGRAFADEDDDLNGDIFNKKHDFKSRGRSLLNNLDDEDNETFSSRRLKVRSENFVAEDTSAMAEEASSRMKASKARLADLETEMFNMSEKHTEREQRNRSLKKLLNESDAF